MTECIRWQFVLASDLASQTIAWFSQGHFSHVDCLLDDGCLLGARADSVGGQPPGVRIRPPNYRRFARRIIMAMPCHAEVRGCYLEFLQEQLGKPYDSEAIWAFLFNRNWREPDSWICSELQAAACEEAGLMPQLYLAANKITPVALALALSATGAIIVPHNQEKMQ